MKQFLFSCFLLIKLSQYHVSTIYSGMEGFSWRDKTVEITLPVSCKTLNEVNVGDDFLKVLRYQKFAKGNTKSWEMKVLQKIVLEDDQQEFNCY